MESGEEDSGYSWTNVQVWWMYGGSSIVGKPLKWPTIEDLPYSLLFVRFLRPLQDSRAESPNI
ncbi:MAG: hypothetical protein SGCHY_002454, partial [Lobulomycetales sp.]